MKTSDHPGQYGVPIAFFLRNWLPSLEATAYCPFQFDGKRNTYTSQSKSIKVINYQIEAEKETNIHGYVLGPGPTK